MAVRIRFHEMASGLLSVFLPLYIVAIDGANALLDIGIMSTVARARSDNIVLDGFHLRVVSHLHACLVYGDHASKKGGLIQCVNRLRRGMRVFYWSVSS